MTTTTITVTNPTRTRRWGWGWSNQPTGRDAYSIALPTSPDYVGTLAGVQSQIAADRTYAAMKSGGTFTAAAWFYDGRRILLIEGEDPNWTIQFGLDQGFPDVLTLVVV